MNGDPSAVAPPTPSPDWQPKWEVDVGHGCKVGIATDDHCFVVLVPAYKELGGGEVEFTGKWRPTPWIPKAAARVIGMQAMG